MHLMPRYLYRRPVLQRKTFARWYTFHAPKESLRGVIRGVCFRERALFQSPSKAIQRRLRKRLIHTYFKRFGADDFYAERAVERLPKLHRQKWLKGGYAKWRDRL